MVAQNAIIYAGDYNSIQTKVANVLGTGSGTLGYGQAVTSAQTTSGTVITAAPSTTQWTYLYADMLKIANHQGTSIAALTTAVTNNVSSGKLIQAADVNLFSTTADTLQTNALNATDTTVITTMLTSTRTTAWGSGTPDAPIQHIFTVQFGTYDNLRYFFNSGGAIQFTASRTGGTSGWAQNTDWTNILTNSGTVTYGATGSTNSTIYGSNRTIAYGSLTSSAQLLYTISGTQGGADGGLYANNLYAISASVSGSIMTFSVVFDDAAKQKSTFDFVDGTISSTILMKKSNTNYVTIASPSFTTTTNL
jgi:hypothetical protein